MTAYRFRVKFDPDPTSLWRDIVVGADRAITEFQSAINPAVGLDQGHLWFVGEDAIRRHLGVLRDAGVVTELVVEPGERVRGYPYKFYRLTEEARELFDRNDLFPADAWRRQYARVEKTGEIAELEAMPRPE